MLRPENIKSYRYLKNYFKSFQILEVGDLVAVWWRHGMLRASLRKDGIHRATEPGLCVQVYTDI